MRGDSLKERILRVATIEEVVAAYVPLQRSGAGYVGLCPFHADKHPSLHVHPGKQFFKCFACGEGGDLFAFVQKIEGCSFTEAMGMLAKRYSIDSREWTVDNYAGKKKRTDGKGTTGKRTAGSSDKTANENSDDQLSVVNSQLSIRTIGAANRLFASLLQPYVPEDEALRETYRLFGVGIAPPEVPADYRKMRSRLIFPIRDEKGGLVAFAARRRTDGEGEPSMSTRRPVRSIARTGCFMRWTGQGRRYGRGGSSSSPKATKTPWRCMPPDLRIRWRSAGWLSLPGISGCWRDIRSGSSCCWMPTGPGRRRWKRSWRCSRAGQARKGSGWSRPVCSK